MPSQIKLGLVALISTAAAIPHAAHDRFHHRRQAGTGAPVVPYPTGGWGLPRNSTILPTGTGTGVVVPDDKTTTLVDTRTSTQTLVKTVYLTPSPVNPGSAIPSSAGAEDVSKGPGGGPGACGPATVYVTATNKVTVTVPAGGAGSPPAATPSAPEVPGGAETPSSPPALPSKDKPSGPPPKPTTEGGYSILPVHSSATPVESKVPVFTPPPPPPPATPTLAPPPPPPATPTPPVVVPSAAPSPPAESSAAPKPSGSPSHSGGKRGLAYNDIALCSAFGGGKFSWAYNWGQAEAGQLPEGVKFVPTMHKPSDSSPEAWLANVDKAVKAGSDMVMGFNEPDHAQQASLDVGTACADWKRYMEPIAAAHPDVTILGPSVTNGPPPMGLDWLSRFQKACPDATWHGANVHFYDIYDDKTVDRFIAQVEKAAADYGKPVYVTEFGLNPGSASPDQAAKFLKGCMDYMDGSDKVKGYSYFMVGAGENQLNAGNRLSVVGQVYNS